MKRGVQASTLEYKDQATVCNQKASKVRILKYTHWCYFLFQKKYSNGSPDQEHKRLYQTQCWEPQKCRFRLIDAPECWICFLNSLKVYKNKKSIVVEYQSTLTETPYLRVLQDGQVVHSINFVMVEENKKYDLKDLESKSKQRYVNFHSPKLFGVEGLFWTKRNNQGRL